MNTLDDMPALVPELLVSNVGSSLAFYRDLLGFEVRCERPEDNFAMVSLQGSWFLLEQTGDFDAVSDLEFVEGRQWRTGALEYPFGRGINFQIVIDDIHPLYERLLQRGYPIKMPIEERWYRVGEEMVGVKQFLILDPDGYLLRLQQDFGTRPVGSVAER